MLTEILLPPPNPTSANDPCWQEFDQYLSHNNIISSNIDAINAYQNSDFGSYLSARYLNHILTLKHFSNGHYASLAKDIYGDEEDDYEYNQSLTEIDRLFADESYSFPNNTILFKGIGRDPFYEILNLKNLSLNDKITFPGFLSTSVCKEKAESFSLGDTKILLKILKINDIPAIVPQNICVLNSPTRTIPEQEILLNRNSYFRVSGQYLDKGFHVIVLEGF
jgi:hypothetical protein